MKHLSIIIAALCVAVSASAQNYRIARVEAYENAGEVVVPDLSTPVAVDIAVTCEQVVAGPYARYAQKYLGVRAPLSDKSTYSITGAQVAILASAPYPVAGEQPAREEHPTGFGGTPTQFGKILPDRSSAANIDPETAARQAAAEIFRLRRLRLDLISGEQGENVFGAGLKTALDELYALEQSYTELFLGKHVVINDVRRIVVYPSADRTSYIVGRFSTQDGVLPSNDLSGEVILLQIRPSGQSAVQGVKVATERERYVTMRVADNSECSLLFGSDELARAVLPLFAFGRDVRVALPSKR